ncbi:hypothetical protein BAE44_0020124 [Dichanthelium oligosanthes]|uniref:Dirigent protein n=1 Tax=Dichanthelium oligosanthes TaxID=888268 RepID=A0A1E5V1C1_9POAL|nr:hypothetical protein BAE44_0020124 [Dichanthelium oligosanthes]
MASLPLLFFLGATFLLATTVHFSSYGSDVNNGRDAAPATTHLHFYMYDDYTSPRPTALRVVSGRPLLVPSPSSGSDDGNDINATATGGTLRLPSPRQFGDIVVLNNALTEGPQGDSDRVGTAQGFGVRVSEGGVVSHVTVHLVLEAGEHWGSSVTVSCRIDVDVKVRESVVVGGTGHFRFARGYMLPSNYDYDLARGGVVELDVYLQLQH